MTSMVRAVATLWISVFRSCAALLRSRQDQAIVELALRQQLAIYARRHSRPRIAPLDRAFWVALSRFLASLEERPAHRSARHGGPLAEASLPILLALDLNVWPRKIANLE